MRIQLTILASLICCSAAIAGTPHPFHTSMAEVEYNPETKRLEVALKLYTVDAETALTRLNGKACDLDDEKQRDRLLEKYLVSRFATETAKAKVTTKTKRPKSQKKTKPTAGQLRYVGSEISGGDLWTYFELPVPPGKSFKLRNDVLVDVQPKQLNVVQFVGPAGKQTTFCNARNRRCDLSLTRIIPQRPAPKK